MKAVICREFGEPEDLEIGELEAPSLGREDVRIAVHTAALNFPDILLVQGKYQYKPSLPFSPGMECAGDVVEVGADVTRFRPGDRVCAHPWIGCFADEVVCQQDYVYAIPDAMDYATGAAFSLAYGTVHHALIDRGDVAAGEVLLVTGAAGGVGLPAIEVGKLLGATVIAAAGTAEKLDLCRVYGADHVVNYTLEALRDAVHGLTADRGADVIFDSVGGDVTDACMRCINWNGRLVIIGFAGGRIARIPANLILLKGCAVVGSAYQRFCHTQPGDSRANMTALFDWWREGRLKPHISMRFPLEDVVAALDAIRQRRATGKVILELR